MRCVGEGLCPSRGRGRTPPLRKRNKRCNGRATARGAPTKALQGGAGESGIPQSRLRRARPPLGKGAEGTGVRIATASVRTGFAMTHCMKCGTSLGGRPQGSPLQSVTRSAMGGPMWASAPTKMLQVVRGKAGRRGYKRCGKTGRRGNQFASSATGGASPISPPAGGVEPRPYGSATRGAMGGRPRGSPLRTATRGAMRKKNPPVTALPCQPPLGKGAGEDGRKQRLFDTIKPPPGGGGFRRGICGEGDLRGGGLFSVGRF